MSVQLKLLNNFSNTGSGMSAAAFYHIFALKGCWIDDIRRENGETPGVGSREHFGDIRRRTMPNRGHSTQIAIWSKFRARGNFAASHAILKYERSA